MVKTTRQSVAASAQGASAAAPAPVKVEPAAATPAAAAAATTTAATSSSTSNDSSDAEPETEVPTLALPVSTPPLLYAASLASSSILQQHKQAGVGGLPTMVTPPTNIARFSTVGPHGPQQQQLQAQSSPFVTAPSSFARQLSRVASTSGPSGISTFANGDWRAHVAVEERINIRRKLREAYFKHCPTYEQLLDTVTAVDEELLFSCSANRIDYFKSSIDWDSRIQLKRQQLRSAAAGSGAAAAAASSSSPPPASSLSKKRSAEDLSESSVSLFELGINNSDLVPPHSGTATLAAAAAAASPVLPPIAQLVGATGIPPKSPVKETAAATVSTLVALAQTNANPHKKQKN